MNEAHVLWVRGNVGKSNLTPLVFQLGCILLTTAYDDSQSVCKP